MTEIETAECAKQDNGRKKSPSKKRRVRPIPITSKIPLYDKLMAEKEERSNNQIPFLSITVLFFI